MEYPPARMPVCDYCHSAGSLGVFAKVVPFHGGRRPVPEYSEFLVTDPWLGTND